MEATAEKKGFEKYPAYKGSGVEWLGDVPEHWDVIKLKRLFHEVKKRTNIDLNCGSISFGKVVFKADEKIPESTKKSYQVVLNGDFLVNPLNLNYDLISLRIALSEIDVVVSSGYIVLHNSVKLNCTYFKWLLHRFDVAYMKILGSGVRQTLNFNDIGNSDLVFPPIEEQTAIANFLDQKTAQIDRAIAQKEKQIELLKERSQVLMHKAVTRGLNPDVSLKDSGVEWIGKVPEHWEVVTIRRITEDHKQGYYNPLGYSDSGYKLIRITDLNDKGMIETEKSPYVNLSQRELKVFQIRKGDFLFPRTGSIGLLGLANNDLQAVFASYLIRFRFKNTVNSTFLKFYFLSDTFLSGLQYDLHGGVLQNLHAENLKNQYIGIPPVEEQIIIAKYLEKVNSKFDSATLCKENEIEKLKEYKATLINSAVTGKIKVN